MFWPPCVEGPISIFGCLIQRELNNPLRADWALISMEAALHSRTVQGTFGRTPSGAIGFVIQ